MPSLSPLLSFIWYQTSLFHVPCYNSMGPSRKLTLPSHILFFPSLLLPFCDVGHAFSHHGVFEFTVSNSGYASQWMSVFSSFCVTWPVHTLTFICLNLCVSVFMCPSVCVLQVSLYHKWSIFCLSQCGSLST